MQFGVKYTLTGPRGDIATFNDQSDPNNVGTIAELTGLDSPDIRENAQDNVEMDGGIHGNFWSGRRPITISGLMHGHATATERNNRWERLKRAGLALRGNSVLAWQWEGQVPQSIAVRANQPMRETGAWNKQFQLALVAADPRIYSQTLHNDEVTAVAAADLSGRSYDLVYDKDYGPATPNGQLLITNAGNWDTFPVYTITGPGLNPSLYNLTTGMVLKFGYNLDVGETLVIDSLNRTILLNGNADRYYSLDFASAVWTGLAPDVNDIRIAFNTFSTGAKLRVDWRDAWL